MYNVYEANFVNICKKFLEDLKINLSFEEIRKLSKYKFEKIVKEKNDIAAFKYLIELRNSTSGDGKMSKLSNIKYEKFKV